MSSAGSASVSEYVYWNEPSASAATELDRIGSAPPLDANRSSSTPPDRTVNPSCFIDFTIASPSISIPLGLRENRPKPPTRAGKSTGGRLSVHPPAHYLLHTYCTMSRSPK